MAIDTEERRTILFHRRPPGEDGPMPEKRTTPPRLFAGEDARFARWRDIPLAILAWLAVAGVGMWILGHLVRSILVLLIAALLAYALSPVVKYLERIMPRTIAVAIVYILVFGGLGAFAYVIISTSLRQFLLLGSELKALTEPGTNHQASQLVSTLEQLGISQDQINAFTQQLAGSIQGIISQILPVVIGVFSTLFDIIVMAVLSIYLMLDGKRVKDWLQTQLPVTQRNRVDFFLDTLEKVVGGYIRGQLVLATVIGLLVGCGMWLFHIPYAVLLGFLAFILEFIPVLGTLTSGVFCVAIALSQGWIFALIVLAYFVGVHIIEGDVLGPRVVGKAIGLHPAVSMLALIAGAELFGVWGALFAAPTAGLIQAFVRAAWIEWQSLHPDLFEQTQDDTPPSDEADKRANPLFPGDPPMSDRDPERSLPSTTFEASWR